MSKPTTPPVARHALGFLQLTPIPASDELRDFYESRYYDLLRSGGRAPELQKLLDAGTRPDELAWLEATLYRDIGDAIRSRASGPVLDVGCGCGDLVAYLVSQGFDASGIEPSREAVAVAQGRGITAAHATLESWAANPANQGRYSAITLINVLEHVPDPLAVLGRLRALLAPGGALCFRVPNDFTELQEVASAHVTRQHWWVASPDHINYFREDSARAACSSAGLAVVDVTVDFPMELLLLMGIDYVDEPARGRDAHDMRRRLELTLPTALRQRLYRSFAALGMGRNLLVTAVRA